MASGSKKPHIAILSKPSQFQKTPKHNLVPPSSYSNLTSNERTESIKTPSDFKKKASGVKPEETLTHQRSSTPPSAIVKQEKYSEMPCTADLITVDKSIISKADENHTNVHLTSNDLEQNMETCSTVAKDSTCDIPYLLSITDESVSKEKYVKLEQMYNESKNKLNELELRIIEMSEDYIKPKVASPACEDRFIEEKLKEEVLNLKIQNERLYNKLQSAEYSHISDFKGALGKYLSQNHFDPEKDTLSKQVIELGKRLYDMEVEKEKMIKTIETQKQKHHEVIVQNEEERYSYEDCIAKLNERVSIMMNYSDKANLERQEYIKQYQKSSMELMDLNQKLSGKDKQVNELSAKIEKEISKHKDVVMKMEKQRDTFESVLSNVEKMLKEEVRRNSDLYVALKEREERIDQLEKNLSQMRQFTSELQSDNDKVSSFKNHFDRQCEEIAQLQSSCRTLQSTNETLNIRLTSANEILKMQQPYAKGSLTSEKCDKMLQMWREKVYSLLVLLKLQETRSKRDEVCNDSLSTL